MPDAAVVMALCLAALLLGISGHALASSHLQPVNSGLVYPVTVTEINDNTANGPALSNNDQFGSSVAYVGDINGDGTIDIAAGAQQDDAGGDNRGAVHVMFMNPDGSVKSTVEINDNTANGPVLHTHDKFGISVAAAGDINGDGVPDIAAGATEDDAGGINRGAVHVMFMNRDGSVKSTAEINSNTANGPALSDRGWFAASVASVGDINFDGIPDIVAGARQDDAGGINRGAVHVMLMDSDGSVKDTIEINGNTANGPDLADMDGFGTSVAPVGDINGDGARDIAVGAYQDDAGGSNRGAVHVMLMNPDGSVKSTAEINSNTANGPDLDDSNWFGTSVASVGDINGDGIPDIAAGAQGDDRGGFNRGAVHVMLMNSDGSVKSTVEINGNTANGPDLASEDRFGVSVASTYDAVNENTFAAAAIPPLRHPPIIVVGANLDDAGGSNRGSLHVISLSEQVPAINNLIHKTIEINDHTANGPDLANGDWFGVSVARINDLDDDGINEIVVGAIDDDAGGSNRGAVHVMFMNRDGSVKSTAEINSNTANGPDLNNHDLFGISVAAVGDINGDGDPDIAVGSHRDDGDSDDVDANRGAVHVMFMNFDGAVWGTSEINGSTANGPDLANGDWFGASVTPVGDINGDGTPDIAVGANQDDAGGSNRGAVHVMFMNPDGSVKSTAEINSNTANGPDLANGDWFGVSVAAVGDINGDGTPDIAAGSHKDLAGGTDHGAVHVMFMNPDGSVKRTAEISGGTANGPDLASGDRFGGSIASMGDMDGDGTPDMAVGAYQDNAGGHDRGVLYIMLMNSDGTVKGMFQINSASVNGPNLNDGDILGRSVAAMGDINRDGITDIVAGAPGDGAGGSNRGAVHIILLDRQTTIQGVTSPQPDGTYYRHETIDVDVHFSEPVIVQGSPTVLLETGDTDRHASYISGNNTETLRFRYVISDGDYTSDLNYASINSLNMAGGSITARMHPNDRIDADMPPTNLQVDINPPSYGPLALNSDIVINGSITTPGIPADLAAAPGNAHVLLTWTEPASNGNSPITGYLIQYKSPSADWPGTAITIPGGTSYNVTNLINGASYDFRISATNVAGTGPASDPVTATLAVQDRGRPILTLSTTATDPTNSTIIPFVATPSEHVTGFAAADIVTSSGTAQGLDYEQITFAFGGAGGGFSNPNGIAVNSTGHVYVADTSNSRIQVFDASGAYITSFGSVGNGMGQLSLPNGIAVNSTGHVYVADTFNNRIQVFDASGAHLTSFGSSGSSTGQFNGPLGIAIDAAGHVYVADTFNSRIQVFDASGAYLSSFGRSGSGSGQFLLPGNVAINSTGHVYVADTFNNRIQVFDKSWTYLDSFGESNNVLIQLNSPQGIAINSTGHVYVADTFNNRIQVFDASGEHIQSFATSGLDNGQFDGPSNVAIGDADQLLVLDAGNNRAHVIRHAYSFNITNPASGTLEVYIPANMVQDKAGNGNTESNRVSLTVSDETAPTITSGATAAFTELVANTHALASDDASAAFAIVSTNVTGNPAPSVSGSTLSWTPSEEQGGTGAAYRVTVSATDASDNVGTQDVIITVAETNEDPVLAGIGARSAAQGQAMTIQLTAADADIPQNTLTYARNGTAGAITATDSRAASFAWTPTGSDLGAHVIRFTVSDGAGGTDSEDVTITVSDETAPTITSGATAAFTELVANTHALASDDASAAFAIVSTNVTGNPAPSVSGSTLSWTPSEEQGGTGAAYRVTVSATDASDNVGTQDVIITVAETNEDPVLAGIGARSAAQGQAMTIQLTAADADVPQNALAYARNGTAGAITATDSRAASFAWTPTGSDLGAHVIRFTVSDGAGGTDSEDVTITVSDETAPTITSGATAAFTELVANTHALASDDASAAFAIVSTNVTGNPAPSVSGSTLSWTPSEEQGGTGAAYRVTVSATDASDNVGTQDVIITVAETNEDPVLADIGSRSASPGAELVISLSATDTDVPQNALAYARNGTAGAITATDSRAASFAWTPTGSDLGAHVIRFTVSDGAGGTDSEDVTITVSDETAPTITSGATAAFTELVANTHALASDDASAAFAIVSTNVTGNPAPSVSGSTLSWTPSEEQGGTGAAYRVTVSATDASDNVGTQDVIITVAETNEDPVLADIGSRSASPGAELVISLSATDTDVPQNALAYARNGTAGAITATDSRAASFAWTPTGSDLGAHVIRFTVSDGAGGTDSEDVTITVSDETAPTITSGATAAFTELVANTHALASDDASAAFAIVSTNVTGNPAPSVSGSTLSWTPSEEQGGTGAAYRVTVSATDASDNVGTQDVIITVAETNEDPVLAGIGARSAAQGQAMTIQLTAADADIPQNTLAYARNGTAGAITATDSRAASFAWTPTGSDLGAHVIRFTVSDGAGGTDSEDVTITVSDETAPTITSGATAAFTELVANTHALASDDASAAFAIVSTNVTGNPAPSVSGSTLSWTPSEEQGGTGAAYRVTVSATDASDNVGTQDVIITVAETNEDPVLAGIGARSAAQGQAMTIQLTAADADIPQNALAYARNGTAGAITATDSRAASFAWTPTGSDLGAHVIRFTVSDGAGGTDSEDVTITVSDETAPTITSGATAAFTELVANTHALASDDASAAFAIVSTNVTGNPAPSVSGSTLSWTPSEEQGGTGAAYRVTVSATDASDNVGTQDVIITVAETNEDPVLADIGSRSASPGAELVISLSATDTDVPQNALAYARNGTAGAITATDSRAASFAWTPTGSDLGAHVIRFTVSDGAGGTDSEDVTITVSDETAPTITSGATAAFTELVANTHALASDDASAAFAIVSTNVTGNPAPSVSGSTLSWTPSEEQGGTGAAYRVTVSATDASDNVGTQDVIITVAETNEDPVLADIGSRSASPGAELVISLSATDTDVPQNALAYARNGTAGAITATDSRAASFAWTPTGSDLGAHVIRFTVSDGAGGTDSEDVTITVSDETAPTITSGATAAFTELVANTHALASDDASAAFAIVSTNVTGNPAPSVSGSTLSWTPSEEQGGTGAAYRVTVSATDASDNVGTQDVIITVAETNEDPVLADIGSRSASPGAELVISLSATDTDVPQNALAYARNGTAGAITATDSRAASFAWTPTGSDLGAHVIRFTVSDGAGGTDSEDVTITVSDETAPTITSGATAAFTELVANTHALASDDASAAFAIVSTNVTGNPAPSVSGSTLSWTPSEEQGGTGAAYRVTVSATDASDNVGTQDVIITVAETNEDPVLADIGSRSASPGAELVISLSATDTDVPQNALAYARNGTAGAITATDSRAASFAWTPTGSDLGAHVIRFTVSDGAGGTDSEDVTITVSDETAPTITSGATAAFTELVANTHALASDDASAAFAIVSTNVTGNPAPSVSGSTLSWTPSEEQGGTGAAYRVTVSATDASDNVGTQDVIITVAETNEDPVLADIGSRSASPGAELVISLSATDTDVPQNALAYARNGTAGAITATDSRAASFAWTPTGSDLGAHVIRFTVSDGAGGTDSEDVTITVSDETAPTITSGATAAFTELVANTHALASDDASAAFAIVSTNVTGNPAPSVSGSTLSWTPSEEQGGTGAAYRVTVSATDASDNVGTQDVIITVAETNEDPVLADIGSRSASPGAELVISLSATDTDVPQNALAYARNGTAGAITATDSRAASFAWTPTGSDLGAHVIRFTVSDGAGGTDSEDVTITVSDETAPTITSGATAAFTELVANTHALASDDASAAFAIVSTNVTGNPAPSVSGSTLSWTPSEEQGGTGAAYRVTVSATDASDNVGTQDVIITVAETNEDPVLADIGSRSASPGAELVISLSATDTDVPQNALAYARNGTAGAITATDSRAASFAWTPTGSDLGAHVIRFTVSDGAGGTDSEDVTITVSDETAPTITSGATAAFTELVANTHALASDDASAAFAIVSTNVTGNPAPSVSGSTLSWTPSEEQGGTGAAYRVTVSATDASDNVGTQDVIITVAETNEDPVLADIGSRSASPGAELVISLSATDTDVPQNALAYARNGTAGAITATDSRAASFAWTPTGSDLGAHVIRFTVSDGAGGTDSEDVIVTVSDDDDDDAPAITSPASVTFTELVANTHALTSDKQGVAFAIVSTNVTGNPAPSASGSTLSWTPSEEQGGTGAAYRVTVSATDASDNVGTQDVIITVAETNEDPVLAGIGPRSAMTGQELTIQLTATDTDVPQNALAYARNGTSGAITATSDRAASFAWTPTGSDLGAHVIRFTVSDGAGGTDSEDVTVTVSDDDDDDAPAITSPASVTFTELVANTHALTSDKQGVAFAIVSHNVTGSPAPSASGSTLSWTPSEEQGGTGAAYRVTVSATDASDNVGTQDVIITVAETNEDPVLAGIGPRSAMTGQELTIQLTATDTDVPQNALAYARNGTSGAITATSDRAASFAWTPTGSDLGAHVIRFTVSDGAGGTDSEDVTVTVSDAPRPEPKDVVRPDDIGRSVLTLSPMAVAYDQCGPAGYLALLAATYGDNLASSLTYGDTRTAGVEVTDFVDLDAHVQSGVPAKLHVFIYAGIPTDVPSFEITIRDRSGKEIRTPFLTSDRCSDVIRFADVHARVLPGIDVRDSFIEVLPGAGAGAPAEAPDPAGGARGGMANGTADAGAEDPGPAPGMRVPDAAQAPGGGAPAGVPGAGAPPAPGADAQDRDPDRGPAVTGNGTSGADAGPGGDGRGRAGHDGIRTVLPHVILGGLLQAAFDAPAGTDAVVHGQPGAARAGAFDAPAGRDDPPVAGAASQPRAAGTGSGNPAAATTGPPADAAPPAGSAAATTGPPADAAPPAGSAAATTGPPADAAPPAGSAAATTGPPADAAPPAGSAAATTGPPADAAPRTDGPRRDAPNRDPVLGHVPARGATVGIPLSVHLDASDADGDALTFRTNATGAWMAAHSGHFAWTPQAADFGMNYIELAASDPAGGTDAVILAVDVTTVPNSAPEFGPMDPAGAYEHLQLRLDLAATDADGDALAYSFAGYDPAPENATLDPDTGVFRWTPGETQQGRHVFSVLASDHRSDPVRLTVSVEVEESNEPPRLALPFGPAVDVTVGTVFEVGVGAADADRPHDALTFATNMTGAAFDPDTGSLTWTPHSPDIGERAVWFGVSDGRGGTDEAVVLIRVVATSAAG